MYRHIALLLLLFLGFVTQAQVDVVRHEIVGEKAIISINPKAPVDSIDKELEGYGLTKQLIDSVWNNGIPSADILYNGWKIWVHNDEEIALYKNLNAIGKGFRKGDIIMVDPSAVFSLPHDKADYPGDVNYGFNQFKRETVVELRNGNTAFYLPGHEGARNVYLSGSFNDWSTGAMPMRLTDSGWVAITRPRPGKHLYKFIIDGHWTEDKQNKLKEINQHGSWNSVYYKPNHRFQLKGFPKAKKVFVSSAANDWREREMAMVLNGDTWELPVYYRQGTHAYKFIVDGKWMVDPENPDVRPDRHGNENSFFSIGEPTTFYLEGHLEAQQVFIAGTFNDWLTTDAMTRIEGGWKIEMVLPPGNYEYKYVIDGSWQVAENNPHCTGPLPAVNPEAAATGNSICSIYPNHVFRLDGYQEATDVRVTGNFNGWAVPGYSLSKQNNGWEISIYLPPGKCLYKFIIDDNWILDPANQYWEQNSHGTGNSVLWIDPLQPFLK